MSKMLLINHKIVYINLSRIFWHQKRVFFLVPHLENCRCEKKSFFLFCLFWKPELKMQLWIRTPMLRYPICPKGWSLTPRLRRCMVPTGLFFCVSSSSSSKSPVPGFPFLVIKWRCSVLLNHGARVWCACVRVCVLTCTLNSAYPLNGAHATVSMQTVVGGNRFLKNFWGEEIPPEIKIVPHVEVEHSSNRWEKSHK